ncbi:MAG: ATP-binding cassette domain-containing protein, partial [Gemmatimonadaceae bacterium]
MMSDDSSDEAKDDGVYNRNHRRERREGDRRQSGEPPKRPGDPGDSTAPENAADTAERTRVRAAIRKEINADDGHSPGATEQGAPVIELSDVYLAFDRPILEGVSFAANEGETVAVVGESGTGKSTIIKLILRLLVADRGEVRVMGQDIESLTYEQALEIRQQMGMVFQGSALFDSLTVYENVAYPLREHTKLNDDEIGERVREKLRYVDLDPDEVTQLAPSELSGGMQKRVGVARGL